MTESTGIDTSLRKASELRGYAFSKEDLISLYELLQGQADDAATLQTAKWVRQEDQSPEDFESNVLAARALFRVFVRIETRNGETTSQGSDEVLRVPDLPRDVTRVEYDSGFLFRDRTNLDPANRVYLLLDFRKGRSDLNVQPSLATPNDSQYIVVGENTAWVRSTKSRLDDFLQDRKRKGIWIHRSGIYDFLLNFVGVLFIAWLMSFFVPIVDNWFSGVDATYRYAGYIVAFLFAIRTFVFLFNYSRWIWPVVELRDGDPILKAHRFIWITLVLGIAGSAIYDLAPALSG